MKSTAVSLLLIIILMTCWSCKNSVPAPQTTSSGTSSTPDNISLMFNGVSMASLMPQAIYSKAAGILQITCIFNSNKILTLNINNAAPGNYSINNGGFTATFSLDNTSSHIVNATTGTIAVSTFSSTIVSGAFQFSGTTVDNIAGEVTNGQFLVHVITQ